MRIRYFYLLVARAPRFRRARASGMIEIEECLEFINSKEYECRQTVKQGWLQNRPFSNFLDARFFARILYSLLDSKVRKLQN